MRYSHFVKDYFMLNVTKHFSLDECKCPCCDRVKITPGFFAHMEKLEEMRQKLGFTLIITSGYRCPNHNTDIEGAPNSWHLLYATDIRPNWSAGFANRLRAMYRVALVQNWGGIGYYSSWIHLDMRTKTTRWRKP